ncbi:uncharacterized protein LOC124414218 [Diprion similis]|uniref:uncharacterized protein LOC124414218 n=1 Tax=Diprion similis TaxID=362088 RepID=UPI001EF8BC29|nr:uncharacterized protein LOC124414218 [Diprion similis]
MMKPSNRNAKLKELLGIILRPDYNAASESTFDDLISHIEKSISNRCCKSCDIDKSILQKWVLSALAAWTLTKKKPDQSVIVFTVKLVELLSQDEFDFLFWYREDVFKKMSAAFGLKKDDDIQTSVKVAYVGMFLQFVNHKSGRHWIIESGAWKEVVKLTDSSKQPQAVTRESKKIVCKLLLAESLNTTFCEQVISAIAKPLISRNIATPVQPDLEDPSKRDENAEFFIALEVLTEVMENTVFATMDNTIPLLVATITTLDLRLQILFETCTKQSFYSHIMNLMYLIVFTRLKDGMSVPDGTVEKDVWRVFRDSLRYIESVLIVKKHIENIVKGEKIFLTYLNRMNKLCKIKEPGDIKIEHHAVLMMIIPMSSCVARGEVDVDILETLAYKIMSMTDPATQRLGYMVRSIVLNDDALPAEDIAKTAARVSTDVLDIVDRDSTVVIFQVMSHTLNNYVNLRSSKKCPNELSCTGFADIKQDDITNMRMNNQKWRVRGDPILKFPHLLSTLMDGIATILTKYQLKWQDCLETISILNLAEDIINHPKITSKICVQALTLCKLAVENFMAPNLALLVQSDCREDEMGCILYKRMHDPNWKVRASTLDVIRTIATISEHKYPAYQDLLIVNGFPELIIDMASNDENRYVRSLALMCLMIFVKINRIWNEKFLDLDLPKLAINLMTNENEAMVRRDAVMLVKELYVHRKWPRSTINEMTHAMCVVVISDPDWEVKVNAILFWQQVIKSHLCDQGMLDGTFPTHTFSKEHRKIVSLDEREIRKRILKALDKLASDSCLGVLLATLEDESDFQVRKASGEIVKRLKKVFVTYKISPSCSMETAYRNEDCITTTDNLSPDNKSPDRRSADLQSETGESEDHQESQARLRNSSTDAEEANFLSLVNEGMHQMSMNANRNLTNEEKLEHASKVGRNEFIQSVLTCDVDSYINEKNRSLRKICVSNFESVVEEIISAHKEGNSTTDMDCSNHLQKLPFKRIHHTQAILQHKMFSKKSSDRLDKLKEVLELLLLPDYYIASATYFDILLSHIEKDISNRCCPNENIDKSVLQKWVLKALDTWTAEKKPCQAVTVFTVKLVGLLGRDEFNFLFWYREDVFKKLNAVFALKDANLQASVKMAYTGMLLEFVNHKSGRQWIVETETWRDVVRFCHSNHTLYVTRESQIFVWKLLLAESENETFCKQVISIAVEPLVRNNFSSQVHPSLEENYLEQNSELLTTLALLTAIMENTLFASMNNTIPRILESIGNLECRIKGLFETCISTNFYAHIMKLLYLLLFMRLKEGVNETEGTADSETWKVFGTNLRYIDSMLVAKKLIIDMARGGKLVLTYWKKINNLCALKEPSEFKMEIHAVIQMIIPLTVCMRLPDLAEDVLEVFIHKLFALTTTYTQRLSYMSRDTLIRGDLPAELIAKTSIQIALDTIDIIDRNSAVIIFQLMSHVLKQYVIATNEDATSKIATPPQEQKKENQSCRVPRYKGLLYGDPIVQCPHLLIALLDGLTIILQKYKLKWQECLETIGILSMAQTILNHPNAIPKVCIQALSLCKLAIQNFMAPNLALLVQSDSLTNEMQPVLYKRVHDPNWEVRDSVLEVINTIATISEDKYPAFQDLLLGNEFPELIVDVATKDGESYVRATALTCIVTFVRINRIWDEKLRHLDLPRMAIDLIANESEAIVRREAVMLVKELYVHRKWPKSTINEMAKAMSVAAVLDLHWEVKVNALQFWTQFIRSHLSDQGMLDGTFPTHTFSKEHKKIVSLNEYEIRRRILKALDELAHQNCLGVLLATLADDSDFQVCKASGEIVKKLQEIFVKYKITASCSTEDDVPRNGNKKKINFQVFPEAENQTRVNTQSETGEFDGQSAIPKEIIDLIVNADDMSLLGSVYKRSNISVNEESSECEKLQYISKVRTDEFLHSVLSFDVDAYIEEKNRWLKTYTNSFSSVVEDIIVAHERHNVNDMDCY